MSGTGHTVKSYEEEMQSLNDNLVMMGSLQKIRWQMRWQPLLKLIKNQ